MSDWVLSSNQYARLWEGTLVTLQVLALAFALGIVLSLIVGIGRLSERRLVRGIALVYVEIFRGVSSIVLLFWFAFALPILLEINQPSQLLLGSVALGMNMGGYGAEIVRGAIQSVPTGQHEASVAINLTTTQRIRHIILPQAMPVLLPPMGNLTIEILKGTALVSLIGLSDLFFEVEKLRKNRILSDDPVAIPVLFLNGMIIYFVLAQAINWMYRLAERRVNSRYQQRTNRQATLTVAEQTAGAGG